MLRAGKLLIGAVGAAVLSSIVPFAGWPKLQTFALSVLLLVPATVAAYALVALSYRFFIVHLTRLSLRPARLDLLLHVPLFVLAVGGYLTNLMVVDAPFGSWARLGYLSSCVLSALALALTFRATRGRGFSKQAPGKAWAQAIAVALAVDALAVAWLDNYGIGLEYNVMHRYLLCASLFGFSGALYFGLQTVRPRGWVYAIALIFPLAASFVVLRDAPGAYAQMARAPGAYGSILLAVRRWSDADGDGFSAAFGGGDCDDTDPLAYPASPERDCFGWDAVEVSDSELLADPISDDPQATPDVIVLLTIDTFRCGFGRGGPDALRNACPELTQMAEDGWARLDARTNFPSTARALASLMHGYPVTSLEQDSELALVLPTRLRGLGFDTEVIVTLAQMLAKGGLSDAFTVVDETLLSKVTSPFRGDSVSERVLTRVDMALRDTTPKAFIWAHYPDPHFPFILDERSPWKRSSLDAYAELVHKTDAAIGKLARAISALPGAERVMLVVTADHGEEFGEHGPRYHGFTLYEEAVRIPIIAWSPGDPRRHGGSHLPTGLSDLAHYITFAARGVAPLKYPSEVVLRTNVLDDMIGMVANDWKLIFNRSRNVVELYPLTPFAREQEDFAALRPDIVNQLGAKLLHAQRSNGSAWAVPACSDSPR